MAAASFLHARWTSLVRSKGAFRHIIMMVAPDYMPEVSSAFTAHCMGKSGTRYSRLSSSAHMGSHMLCIAADIRGKHVVIEASQLGCQGGLGGKDDRSMVEYGPEDGCLHLALQLSALLRSCICNEGVSFRNILVRLIFLSHIGPVDGVR